MACSDIRRTPGRAFATKLPRAYPHTPRLRQCLNQVLVVVASQYRSGRKERIACDQHHLTMERTLIATLLYSSILMLRALIYQTLCFGQRSFYQKRSQKPVYIHGATMSTSTMSLLMPDKLQLFNMPQLFSLTSQMNAYLLKM